MGAWIRRCGLVGLVMGLFAVLLLAASCGGSGGSSSATTARPTGSPQKGGDLVFARTGDLIAIDPTAIADNLSIWAERADLRDALHGGRRRQGRPSLAGHRLHRLARQAHLDLHAAAGCQVLERHAAHGRRRGFLHQPRPQEHAWPGVHRLRHHRRHRAGRLDRRHHAPSTRGRRCSPTSRCSRTASAGELRRQVGECLLQEPRRHRTVHVRGLEQGPVADAGQQSELLAGRQALSRQRHLHERARRQHTVSAAAGRAGADRHVRRRSRRSAVSRPSPASSSRCSRRRASTCSCSTSTSLRSRTCTCAAAISYAIDRKAMVTRASLRQRSGGQLLPAADPPLLRPQPADPGSTISQGPAGDGRVGVPEGLHARVPHRQPAADMSVAQIVQQALKPLGIQVKIRTVDVNQLFTTQGKGDYQMSIEYWTMDIPDPDERHRVLLEPGGWRQLLLQHYNNPADDQVGRRLGQGVRHHQARPALHSRSSSWPCRTCRSSTCSTRRSLTRTPPRCRASLSRLWATCTWKTYGSPSRGGGPSGHG